MDSLKAVLVYDVGGACFSSKLSSDFTVNPHLITGMLTALSAFNHEVLGGFIDSIYCSSGLKVFCDQLSIAPCVSRYSLDLSSDFPINDNFIKCDSSDFNDYFIADCFNSRTVNFSGIIKSLSFNDCVVRVIDSLTNLPVHFCKYSPVVNYVPSNSGLVVNYALIYDVIDDSLDGFFSERLSNLKGLLLMHSNNIGSFFKSNDLSFINSLNRGIDSFFDEYNLLRAEKFPEVVYNQFAPKLSGLDNVSVNKMKESINELINILKPSQ